MRVKISLVRPPSAVQLGHCRPRPPPIQNSPQRFAGCRGLLPPHLGGDALALLLGLGVPTLDPLALRPNASAIVAKSAPPPLSRISGRAGFRWCAPPPFSLLRGRAGCLVACRLRR